MKWSRNKPTVTQAAASTEVTNDAVVAKQRSATKAISEKQIYRMHEDLLKLRIALDECENLTLFNREQLHRIYREVYKDPHLISQWCTRKLKTLEKEFNLVNEADEPNPKATQLLDSQWFMDLMDELLESKLWGFRLIELGPVKDKKIVPYRAANNRVYDAINPINPDHVKPEWGTITLDAGTASGVPFEGGPYDAGLIFVGKRHDFGIMLAAVKYVLFKNNCVENWSEWAEIFGMDMRVGKTFAEGDTRKEFLNTLKTMGSSGYGIIDKEDEIEHFGTARTDAYKVYQELINTADTNVSKLIFGQDVISNNTGHVIGKTGENVSNLYGTADAKWLARVINDLVLPKLINLGFTELAGLRFKWDTNEKLTMTEQSEIDYKISQMGYKPAKKYLEDKYGCQLEELPEPTAAPAPGAAPGKKSNTQKVANALAELYADAVE